MERKSELERCAADEEQRILSTFLYLAGAFIGTTVIGTLSHECGHWFAAWLLGDDATISYGATHIVDGVQLSPDHRLLFVLGGPIQTIFTGTIGVVLSIRVRGREQGLTIRQWAVVFLSLFWLRPLANAVVGAAELLLTGSTSMRGDEFRIADYVGLPHWSVLLATAAIGALVLLYVTVRVVPRHQQSAFLSAGLVGGIVGYLVWLE